MLINRHSLHTKIRLSAFLLFVCSLPFSILVNNISIMLLLLNWLLEGSFKTKWLQFKKQALAHYFIILYIAYIMGLIYSANSHQGLFELEKKMALFLMPLLIATSPKMVLKDLRLVFKAFIFSCTLATFFCFAYAIYRNYQEDYTLSYLYNAIFYDIHVPNGYTYLNYWYFTYELFSSAVKMHPVYLSMYIVFDSCLIVYLWWNKPELSKKNRIMVLLLLVYNFLVILLLSSRTQLFSLILFGTSFLLYQSYINRKMLRSVLFMLAVYAAGFAIILFNPVLKERFIDSNKFKTHFSDNKYGAGGLSLRMYKWRYAVETIEKSPLVGTGTGDAQDQLQLTYKKHDFKIAYDERYNAHNQFLQTFLEIGIGGLLLLCVGFFVPLYLAIKGRKWLYVVFILVFLISCLTESMLEANKGIVFYAFFNSLFAFYFMRAEDGIKEVELPNN